jgi:hypothetical protein
MADAKQQAHALVTYFQKAYQAKFNTRAIVNRNKLQNLLVNMLRDITVTEARAVIDFYIKTDRNPTLLFLCYEYDEVLQQMQAHQKDLERRQALMRETQKNVEEFRRRYGAT